MGIISLEKADHLFWLGRYTERVFTTLDSFFKYYDKMLDVDDQAYKNFCESIAIPSDIYTDKEDFIRRYLFDSTDYNSIYSNMLRAFDNGVILRDELSSTTLSYLQMALDCMEQKGSTGAVIYDLQPVLDDIFAFWGCLDDKVEDEECRNLIKCGKYLERLDLYMRIDYPYKYIEKEFSKFQNRLHKVKIGYSLGELDRLAGIISLGESWRDKYYEALNALWNIF